MNAEPPRPAGSLRRLVCLLHLPAALLVTALVALASPAPLRIPATVAAIALSIGSAAVAWAVYGRAERGRDAEILDALRVTEVAPILPAVEGEVVGADDRDAGVEVPAAGPDVHAAHAAHEAHEALREREARHRTVISALSEGLILFSDQGELITINPAAERILSRSAAQLRTLDLCAVLPGLIASDGSPLAPEDVPSARAARTGEPQRDRVISFERPDGRRVWISVNAEPLGATAPHPVVTTFTDVTAHRESEAQLRAALAAEKRFLAAMSHEIRTPLNGVIGFLDLLATATLGEAERSWLDRALLSAKHLLSLIHDILDVSKLEAGQIALSCEEFDADELLRECVSIISANLRPGVTLTHTLPSLGRLVTGDPMRTRQIVLNLLGNAAKFTERGSVRIAAAIEERAGERARLDIVVEDTGVGIPADRLPTLFQQFRQAHDAGYGGTGLGLFLSRVLARMLGGDITVESAPGVGSRFRVTLDVGLGGAKKQRAPRGEGEPRSSRLKLRALRVLVVDDSPVNRGVVENLLETFFEVRPDLACDGAEAVELVRAASYDLVLMDVQMPVLDGFGATRRIRELGLTVPIVALTASALSDDLRRAEAAGMDAYLTKPVRPADLERVLTTYGRAASPSAPPAVAPRVDPPIEAAPASAGEPPLRARALLYFDGMVGRAAAEELVNAAAASVCTASAALTAARERRDRVRMARELHKLRGVLLNCGIADLAEQAGSLERALGEPALPRSFPPRVDALTAALGGFGGRPAHR